MFFSYTYGQVIPDLPPPRVGGLVDFAVCDGTPETEDKTFCFAAIEENCVATGTIVCFNKKIAKGELLLFIKPHSCSNN